MVHSFKTALQNSATETRRDWPASSPMQARFFFPARNLSTLENYLSLPKETPGVTRGSCKSHAEIEDCIATESLKPPRARCWSSLAADAGHVGLKPKLDCHRLRSSAALYQVRRVISWRRRGRMTNRGAHESNNSLFLADVHSSDSSCCSYCELASNSDGTGGYCFPRCGQNGDETSRLSHMTAEDPTAIGYRWSDRRSQTSALNPLGSCVWAHSPAN
jgi:hypothetical protein